MFENFVVLVHATIDDKLHLVRADEFEVGDGQILGYLDPEVFSPDDLYDMYRELASNEDFEVKPLNYSGDNFDEARKLAMQVHPGGWEPAEDFDGSVCYNGAHPFKAGGKWYSIYFYWEDIMDI